MNIYDIPETIIKYIVSSTDKNNKLNSAKLRYMPSEIKEWFNKHTDISPRALFKLLDNNEEEIPKCPICGKKLSAYQYEKGHVYCSNKCAQSSPDIQTKICTTFQKNHNGNSVGHDPEVNNKRYNTNISKYGCKCSLSNDDIKLKAKNTCLLKYGVDHPSKSEEFQNVRKTSYIKSCMLKYNTENVSQVKDIAIKISMTKKDRYYSTFIALLKEHHIQLLSPKEDYINRKELNYKCTNCNTEFSILEKNRSIAIRCPNCKYESFVSNKQKELCEWIKTIYHKEVECNNRSIISPYELDIYIPEKNIAIEFNGTYWHSEIFKDKNYHQKKTLLCRSKNIRLIHVSENEWDNNKECIKSVIASSLGIYNKKVYARQCKYNNIESKEYKRFLSDNHLQGPMNSKWKAGLYYNDELIAVIGIGSSRFTKSEIELHRCCFKNGVHIIGGFSKLLSNIIKDIQKDNKIHQIVSYIDLNHFNGQGYYKYGFIEDKITPPNYHYVNTTSGEYISRESAQKHKLLKLLGDNFNPLLTEQENMINSKWLRIYNAGNIRMIYSLE